MKKLLIIFCCIASLWFTSCDDDSGVKPTATAENVIFFTHIDSDKKYSVYRVASDGTGKVKIAEDANIWGHSFKNKIVYTKHIGNTSEVVVANADGTEAKTIATVNSTFVVSVLSPDATKVMYYYIEEPFVKIYTVNADGTNNMLIISDGRDFTGPAFSPDSKQIAFLKRGEFNIINDKQNSDSLFVINVNGTGRTLVSTEVYTNWSISESLDWSPDGSKIAGVTDRTDSSEIVIINTDGSGSKRIGLQDAGEARPIWSPDGKKIAFVTAGTTISEGYLKIIDIDGSNVKNILTVVGQYTTLSDPQWSPDGQLIVYNTRTDTDFGNNAPTALKTVNISTSQTITLDDNGYWGFWKK